MRWEWMRKGLKAANDENDQPYSNPYLHARLHYHAEKPALLPSRMISWEREPSGIS